MQGSVRKKGATWSYRIELGIINGKRSQIERRGFKTKKEATMAMQEVIYNYNVTGDFVENKKITFDEIYSEFIEKEAPATRAYATIVRYKSLYKNHLKEPFSKYYMYQITANMINDFINEKMVHYSEEYVKGIFKLLKVLFGYAHKRQYTKKNIFPAVIAPPDPRHVGEIKTYSDEERHANSIEQDNKKDVYTMKKFTILRDADDTIVNLTDYRIAELNQTYGLEYIYFFD